MTSYIVDVLRQGIWASLTGGWYFDPSFTLFCNTFHLYFWLLLFCFPLATYLFADQFNIVAWLIYSTCLGIIFIMIKVLNLRLHHTFDTNEVIEESKLAEDDAVKEDDMEAGAAAEENANILPVTVEGSSSGANNDENQTDNASTLQTDDKQLHTDVQVDIHNALLTTMDDPALSSLPHDIAVSCADPPPTEPGKKAVRTGLSRTDSDLVDSRLARPVYTPEMQSAVDVCKSRSQIDYPKHRTFGRPRAVPPLRRTGAIIRRSRSSVDSNSAPFQIGRFTVQRRSTAMFSRERHRLGGLITTEHYPYSEGEIFPRASIKFRSRSEASSLDVSNSYYPYNKPMVFPFPIISNRTVEEQDGLLSGEHIKSAESLLKMESGSLKSKSYANLHDDSKLRNKLMSTSRSSPSVFVPPACDLFRIDDELKVTSPVGHHPSRVLQSSMSTAAQCTTLPFSPNEVTGEEAGSLSQVSLHTDTDSTHSSIPSLHRLFDIESEHSYDTLSMPSFYYLFDSADDESDREVEKISSRRASLDSGKREENSHDSPNSATELIDEEDLLRRKPDEEEQGAVGGEALPDDPDSRNELASWDLLPALETRPRRRSSRNRREERDGRTSRLRRHRPRRHQPIFESFPGADISDTLRRRRREQRSVRITEELAITPEPTDPNRHVALSHNDTSHGAMHCFQDERGNWLFYTFGESGVAQDIHQEEIPNYIKKFDSNSPPSSPIPSPRPRFDFSFGSNDTQLVNLREFLAQHRRSSSTSNSEKDGAPKPKLYYNFNLLPQLPTMKLPFDRLWLLALLDRNLGWLEAFAAVLLSVLCALLAGQVLKLGFYHDLWLLLFFYVLASCQFSLLKSVQPDAASPTHGYNRVIAFSRPVYFCLLCSIILLFHYCVELNYYDNNFRIYGVKPFGRDELEIIRNVAKIVILCLPLIYTLGLLPQISTFTMCLFEQIDIHVFGGTGTTSLLSAAYCLARSILLCSLLFSFSLVGLQQNIEPGRHAAFSVFSAFLVAFCYHLSRSASDFTVMWKLISNMFPHKEDDAVGKTDPADPLPATMMQSLKDRLRADVVLCVVIAILIFAVHVSGVFTIYPNGELHGVLIYVCTGLGALLHYLLPQLRKEMPWLCLAHPLLETKERRQFEVHELPDITWFEKLYIWLRIVERNVLLPVVFLSAISTSSPKILERFKAHPYFAYALITICSVKMLRSCFTSAPKQYMIMLFTYLFFTYDYANAGETFLVDYFLVSFLYSKMCNFVLRLKFVYIYVAPWQIAWGSGFHAFAQPFSVPHSVMLLVQTAVSALIDAPLNPFLGSAIFITSYARPLKFWERDYNTKRVDHSNTKLSSQLEKNPGSDDDNLNSLFYEHLSRSLQTSLCGDVLMGRWGAVEQGDCFVMASDNMNALVHIVEMGNGLITFQLRGLEFRGTYCQQREVEAISEGVEDDEGFCCFDIGHLPHFLSVNAAFGQRWLAWEVVVTYVLQSYSISDNNAASTLQMFEHRKVLVTCYVKSLIYYTIRSDNLERWLGLEPVQYAIEPLSDPAYVDVDTVFNSAIDIDFDIVTQGVSKRCFVDRYLPWMQYCLNKRDKPLEEELEVGAFNLCFALSLLARRALIAASLNHVVHSSVDFFLFGLHALFKGDVRVTCSRDEWVFSDMDILQTVISPAVRMSLKLHQDHVASYEDFENSEVLYSSIQLYETEWVISHEADPAWRTAVLANTPHLLALRHVMEESGEEYKIIMLNKKCVNFRVIKVNRECVRGLWAGQQQELIFLRNPNAERGSIQNAKQVLRNFINSSCDQPIGYPIYVSPLLTSFSATNEQYKSIAGGEIGVYQLYQTLRRVFNRLRLQCGGPCTGTFRDDLPQSCPPPGLHGSYRSRNSNISGSQRSMRGSNIALSVMKQPTKLTSPEQPRVRIIKPNLVLDHEHMPSMIEDYWSPKSNKDKPPTGAAAYDLHEGDEGIVVHKWMHPPTTGRFARAVYLIQIGSDKLVPVFEGGFVFVTPSGAHREGDETDPDTSVVFASG